jgi:hypothetical protein
VNDAAKTHLIELDSMALMLLKHLREHGAVEPQVPEEGRYEHEEMSALHYEWSRAHQAIRLLVGIQLVNLAIDQIQEGGATD